MSRIRGKDTTPEKAVRSLLHRMGYRFRLHGRKLPGRPDVVLARYKTVIFVHGCFWHQHGGCKYCRLPKSNRRYWVNKLLGNHSRDEVHRSALRKLGWRVVVIWECETEKARVLTKKINRLAGQLRSHPPPK
jgi:DNA mismatch endonuclease (patch repair protein)